MDGLEAIRTYGLAVGYDGRALVGGIDLTVPRGSFNIIVGANGSGKTTLLNTLAGTLAPVAGTVRVLGKDVSGMSRRALARTLGIVYTERVVDGGLTVRRLVEMGRYPYTGIFGRLNADDRRIVSRAIEAVGIGHKADSTLGRISDGERQKAMIGRALAQQTPVLLLDEPTNFLDAAGRVETMALLRRLVDGTGLTVVMTTHDMATALAVADNVIAVGGPAAGVAMEPVGTPAAAEALSRLFDGRPVRFDPDRLDFIPAK